MNLRALEKEISKIDTGRKPNPAYVFLVERFPPRDIANAKEHRAFQELVGTLLRAMSGGIDKRSQEGIRCYLSVLTPFIKSFEAAHWPRKESSGREILAFLMDQHSLKQEDLGREIGKQPYVSDILAGKKNLTAEQISKLAKRFGVSPAVFFP